MRGLQISLNKTQKIRLERALELLDSFSSKTNSNASVTVADVIPVDHEDGILKGHGTSEMDGRVVATLCGVVERVNKLVYVRCLRARYKPEVGDIIVGRVIEVIWHYPFICSLSVSLKINPHMFALLCSSKCKDGIQRRRTAVDELNMRSIFEENDVVCAEVRGFQHDGSLHLQARSQKYGKLERGQLLIVSPYLVKKRKQHFHHLDQYQIDLILGCNGFIWIGEHVDVKDDTIEDQLNKSMQPSTKSSTSMILEEEEKYTPPEIRLNICRIANAIRVLSNLGFMITVEVLLETVGLSESLNHVHEMLGAEFYVMVAEKEAERRSQLTKKR
nr:exosome complex component RRP4 homolog [Ipomoea batatas]